MSGFHDVLFPLAIAFGSTGGPERRTDIIALASGHEERNARWADSRRRYNAAGGVRSLSDIHRILAFFEARRGRLYGFRWRDVLDWRSGPPDQTTTPIDQVLGVGDGQSARFQLVKVYGNGEADPAAARYERPITKPVRGTVRIAVDGAEQNPEHAFSVDDLTGEVTFAAGDIPAAGHTITAGFEFDVPVRFDTDHLTIDLAAFDAGEIPSIPLVEIRT